MEERRDTHSPGLVCVARTVKAAPVLVGPLAVGLLLQPQEPGEC